MKTYYELLDIAPGARPDEIKHAFRREIAKYHPDKVQHLGKEFQEIAAVKASELTQAYKTLTDADLRAEYDGTLDEVRPETPAAAEPPVAPPPSRPVHEPVVERIEDAAPPNSVLGEQFADNGFKEVRVLFYHFHALPPMSELHVPELFRQRSVAMENPTDWRGHFMASAFLVAARRA